MVPSVFYVKDLEVFCDPIQDFHQPGKLKRFWLKLTGKYIKPAKRYSVYINMKVYDDVDIKLNDSICFILGLHTLTFRVTYREINPDEDTRVKIQATLISNIGYPVSEIMLGNIAMVVGRPFSENSTK